MRLSIAADASEILAAVWRSRSAAAATGGGGRSTSGPPLARVALRLPAAAAASGGGDVVTEGLGGTPELVMLVLEVRHCDVFRESFHRRVVGVVVVVGACSRACA